MNLYELHWAAGFLEGEGCFGLRDRKTTKHGRSLDLKASQVNPEPLYRLRALFGGSVYGPYKHRPSMKIRNQQPFYEWHVGGSRAGQAFMTLYVLMSDVRRRAITKGLKVWRTVPIRGAAQTHCHRGHAFTPENTYVWRNHRGCLTCQALRTQRSIQSTRDRIVLKLA